MIRLLSGIMALFLLVSCGADGMPSKPTKPLKERLEDKVAEVAAKDDQIADELGEAE